MHKDQVNGKDPLRSGPTATAELFGRFSKAADGFPTAAAVEAAANVLLNAIRQANATRPRAELAFDELFGQLKASLVAHYDGASGARKSIFPFHQNLLVPFVKNTNKVF
jgi:hypothetical protein